MKTNYYGESPCINAIWILLENLADRGLLIPRIQSTVLPNKKNQIYERSEESSSVPCGTISGR